MLGRQWFKLGLKGLDLLSHSGKQSWQVLYSFCIQFSFTSFLLIEGKDEEIRNLAFWILKHSYHGIFYGIDVSINCLHFMIMSQHMLFQNTFFIIWLFSTFIIYFGYLPMYMAIHPWIILCWVIGWFTEWLF